MQADETSFVTGGPGFIAVAASRLLAEVFGRVVAMDTLHPQVHPAGDWPDALGVRVERRRGDARSRRSWSELLCDVRPDVVVHLAAETGTGQSLIEAASHAGVNVLGTAQMLDAPRSAEVRPQRIVPASSRAVYGEGSWQLKDGTSTYPPQRTRASLAAGRWDFADASPTAMSAGLVEPRPASVYGVAKLSQEGLLRVWARAERVELAVLRLQNVYGPGQSIHDPYTGLFCALLPTGGRRPAHSTLRRRPSSARFRLYRGRGERDCEVQNRCRYRRNADRYRVG